MKRTDSNEQNIDRQTKHGKHLKQHNKMKRQQQTPHVHVESEDDSGRAGWAALGRQGYARLGYNALRASSLALCALTIEDLTAPTADILCGCCCC